MLLPDRAFAPQDIQAAHRRNGSSIPAGRSFCSPRPSRTNAGGAIPGPDYAAELGLRRPYGVVVALEGPGL